MTTEGRVAALETEVRTLRGDHDALAVDHEDVRQQLLRLVEVLVEPGHAPVEAPDPWAARLARFRERARAREREQRERGSFDGG